MFSLELMKFIFENNSNLLKENNILYDFQFEIKILIEKYNNQTIY